MTRVGEAIGRPDGDDEGSDDYISGIEGRGGCRIGHDDSGRGAVHHRQATQTERKRTMETYLSESVGNMKRDELRVAGMAESVEKRSRKKLSPKVVVVFGWWTEREEC